MITLWHNPRCSKSRQALALLEGETGVTIRKYLENPPSEEEIREVLVALGNPPAIKMMRTGEKVFKELGLSKSSSDSELIAAMASHPILIERPIACTSTKAAIGRPPEDVMTLL